MEEESYVGAQSWGGGKGKATYYRVPPRLGICKEKKSSHFTKGHLAAAWPCPTPLWARAPSTAPRVEAGPSSDLTLENSGWVSGPGHRASLPGQPENRAVISLPATKPLSTPDPIHPLPHTHRSSPGPARTPAGAEEALAGSEAGLWLLPPGAEEARAPQSNM